MSFQQHLPHQASAACPNGEGKAGGGGAGLRALSGFLYLFYLLDSTDSEFWSLPVSCSGSNSSSSCKTRMWGPPSPLKGPSFSSFPGAGLPASQKGHWKHTITYLFSGSEEDFLTVSDPRTRKGAERATPMQPAESLEQREAFPWPPLGLVGTASGSRAGGRGSSAGALSDHRVQQGQVLGALHGQRARAVVEHQFGHAGEGAAVLAQHQLVLSCPRKLQVQEALAASGEQTASQGA